MKVLKWLVIVVVALIALVVGAGFALPDNAHVERSIVVNAKPVTVYTVLNGFRQFNKWSPWAKLDPNAQYTIEGPATGVGAKQSWTSQDPNVGSGSQEIIAVTPNQSITQKLVFADFDSDNTAIFTLTPEGEGTRVVWGFDMGCKGDVMCRYFGLMMDKMLGPDYESGLLGLQALVETLPKDDFSDLEVEVLETKPVTVAYIYGEAPADQAGPKLGELYGKVMKFVTGAGSKQVDAPMAITHEFNDETKFWKFDAAIPVDKADLVAPAEGEVKVMQTYAGMAIKVIHKGAYSAMEPTYNKLMAYKAARGFEDNGNSWEHYVTDPGSTPEADLVTNIYWPVK